MWIPRSKPSPCARTIRMSPTRGLCPPSGAHASHFELRVGERPFLDRPDEGRLPVDVGEDVVGMLGGQASLQRRVFGGGVGVGSKRVAEREVPALPRASDLAYMDV